MTDQILADSPPAEATNDRPTVARPSPAIRVASVLVGVLIVGGFAVAADRITAPAGSPSSAPTEPMESSIPSGPDLQIDLPDGWVRAQPGSDVRGADVIDGNRTLQGEFDRLLQAAGDRSATELLFDPATRAHMIVSVTEPPVEGDFDATTSAVRDNLRANSGVTMVADSALTLSEGRGQLFRYDVDYTSGSTYNVQIVIRTTEAQVVIVGQAPDPDALDPVEEIASTITIS